MPAARLDDPALFHQTLLDFMAPAQLDAVVALCSEVFKLDYGFYMNLDLGRVHVLGYALQSEQESW